MTKRIVQFLDSEGEPMGLVKTNLDKDVLLKEYQDWYNDDGKYTGDIDDFINSLEYHKQSSVERIFIEEEINP